VKQSVICLYLTNRTSYIISNMCLSVNKYTNLKKETKLFNVVEITDACLHRQIKKSNCLFISQWLFAHELWDVNLQLRVIKSELRDNFFLSKLRVYISPF